MLRPRLLRALRSHLREGVCTWKLSSCPRTSLRKSPWAALEHRVEVGSSRAACVRAASSASGRRERIPTPVPDSARRRPSRLSVGRGGGTCAQPASPPTPTPLARPRPPQAKLAGLGDDCAAAAARGKRVPDGRRAAAGSAAATERAFQLELPRASCLSQERTRGTMETESRAVSAWGPPGPARRAGGRRGSLRGLEGCALEPPLLFGWGGRRGGPSGLCERGLAWGPDPRGAGGQHGGGGGDGKRPGTPRGRLSPPCPTSRRAALQRLPAQNCGALDARPPGRPVGDTFS